MAEVKTKPTNADAMEFLKSIKDPRKRADSLEILKMMKEITGREPVMWGEFIVGFGQYTIRDSRGKENVWPLIAFSPRVQNLTLYVMPGQERIWRTSANTGKTRRQHDLPVYQTNGRCGPGCIEKNPRDFLSGSKKRTIPMIS